MKPSKKGSGAKSISIKLSTLHEHLYRALNLGFRNSNERERKWQSNDVEIQRLVLRSALAFLDYVGADTFYLSIVKDSAADIVRALEGILLLKQENVLSMASVVALKLVSTLPNSILQPYVIHLVHPLASLLSFHQPKVSVPCATALKLITANLSIRKEKEVWQILEETDAVAQIIRNLQKLSGGLSLTEYFSEMASLLSFIVERWPPLRYPVYSNAELMKLLKALCVKPDNSLKLAILQLFSALALCGKGAEQLMDIVEALTKMISHCMDNSHPQSLRFEAFRLARRLMVNEQVCSEVMKLSCECTVKLILREMTGWSLSAGEVSHSQMSLLIESCCLALITRWPGKHHSYFWKLGVDKVLLDLIICNFHYVHPPHALSMEELITLARDCLTSNYLSVLRPYVWEILGWLLTHCTEDFSSGKHIKTINLNVLVTTACLAFVDSIGRKRHLCQADQASLSRSIAAGRATLMIMYSPCKYIACLARSVLSELFKIDGVEHLKYLLQAIDFTSSIDKSRIPDDNQLVICMIGLACYSSTPQFCRSFIRRGGMKKLLAFVRWWLSHPVHIENLRLFSYSHGIATEKPCCRVEDRDWEGGDILLLLAFCCLAELLNHCGLQEIEVDIFADQNIYSKEQLIMELQNICLGAIPSGLRWYASYLLSFLGSFGFPSKLGKRIGIVLSENEPADLRLVLGSGESVCVHSVVLFVRCPLLVPPGELPNKDRGSFDGSSAEETVYEDTRTRKEVTLNAQVDCDALIKVLDYVYSGNLQAGEGLLRKLKILAKHCNLQPLLQLLSRKRPKWGTPYPSFDLTPALEPACHILPDIILEAKSTGRAECRYTWCSFSSPHLHVHKTILCSSFGYIRAVYLSGMRESRSPTCHVPVSLEALEKLVLWLYSGKLPTPVSGCVWNNMDVERKVQEVKPYIELCWLAEFWFIDDILEDCQSVVNSCLDSAPELSPKIIQMCADVSQWKLTEVAVNYMAPVYQDLRQSGALDLLNDDLVDIIRAASVKHSRERRLRSSP